MSWWNVGAAAITVVGAVISSNAASNTAGVARQAADLQWDIADRVQRQHEEMFEIWRTEYRPGELALRSQIDALRPYQVNRNRTSSRTSTNMRRQYSEARRATLSAIGRLCSLPPAGLINEMTTSQVGAEVWASNAMIRAEDILKRNRDVANREERRQFAQFARRAYFKTGSSEMAAQIARNLQVQASAAASQQSGAAAQLATTGFNYAMAAFKQYQANQPDITQQPERWENDSAMANAQRSSSPYDPNNTGVAVVPEQPEQESDGGGGGGGGLFGGLLGGGGGGFDLGDIF